MRRRKEKTTFETVLYDMLIQNSDKTVEAFNRLPDEFTIEDVMISFSLSSEASARSRVRRLVADNLVGKSGEFKEDGKIKSIFKKTGKIMR